MKGFVPLLLALCSICQDDFIIVQGFSPSPSSPAQRWQQQQQQQQQHGRTLSMPRPLQSVPTFIDTLTSGLASICRLSGGVTVSKEAISSGETSPPMLLSIRRYYWIENDVNCRRVSERITELDLCVDAVIPAAVNSRAITESMSTTNPYALDRGLKPPILVVQERDDTNDGIKNLYLEGVDDILAFLNEKFGIKEDDELDADEASLQDLKKKAVQAAGLAGNYIATFLRYGRGMDVSKAAGPLAPRPNKPLILYDYTGNQFSRLVREVLMELDLVFELRSVGKESPRRNRMAQETGGSTQCPHLKDPNTGKSIKGSKAIIEYLYQTYALYTPPTELLEWASDTILSFAKPVLNELAKIQAGSRSDDPTVYEAGIAKATREIEREVASAPVVVYTYEWSPFSWETKTLLERSNVAFEEVSLGKEWFPFAIAQGGSEKRAALLRMTGQSSLPNIFVGGKSIGGLFSGEPGLVPALAQGKFKNMVDEAWRAITKEVALGEAMPFS